MSRVLYLACSPYSGSTLTSFLLNTHPDIATIGHTIGWPDADPKTFRCSCGDLLDNCTLFSRIAINMRSAGLPFDIRDFGTAFQLAGNDRLNRALTGGLPLIGASETGINLARLRNRLLRNLPVSGPKLARQARANRIVIDTVLQFMDAEVLLDNSQDPHRIEHMSRIPGIDIDVLFLVRDPRGVVLSMMRHKGWDAGTAAHVWLNDQRAISRIVERMPKKLVVSYEALCAQPSELLGDVHRFVGLQQHPFDGDFKRGEHHILGNDMRIESSSIKVDQKWVRELSERDQATTRDVVLGGLNGLLPEFAALIGTQLGEPSRSQVVGGSVTQVSNA